MNEIYVAGRADIEAGLVIRGSYIVISIRDPGSRVPRIAKRAGMRAVLRLKFHDMEPPTSGRPANDSLVPMSVADARRVWRFVDQYAAEVDALVVHCEQGASRSPAVAAAVIEVYGLVRPEWMQWAQPNRYVYQTMLNARAK